MPEPAQVSMFRDDPGARRRAQAGAWARFERIQGHLQLLEGDLEAELPPGWIWESSSGWPVFRPRWLGACSTSQMRRVERGLHPMGYRLHSRALQDVRGRPKCGQCEHHSRYRGGSKRWSKCTRFEHEHGRTGQSGDIRGKWGACEHFLRHVDDELAGGSDAR